MYLTGDPEIDKTIKEIATETAFDLKTAKHFFLKTGDKEYCIELSRMRGMGLGWEHIEFQADMYALKKAKESDDALKN